jgi:uncharacterized protein
VRSTFAVRATGRTVQPETYHRDVNLAPLARSAAWTHVGVRTGFEVLFVEEPDLGHRLRGHTTAREKLLPWSVAYQVELDSDWRTRSVWATNSTVDGERAVSLVCENDRWAVNGVPRPDLDGCVDVDFESSAATNTLPLHRVPFVPGEAIEVPAAFIRADDLRIERLEQRYTLESVNDDWLEFHYESSTFDFECQLRFDRSGLVLDYPGIAVRER